MLLFVNLFFSDYSNNNSSMRRTTLPKVEKNICHRLKKLRAALGMSEEAAAEAAGISKHLWHNYEVLRAPIRCDVALRICRELIISEEWLATGTFDLVEAEAVRRKIGRGQELHEFYLRQSLDLQAEPEFLQIRPGTLFSEAYQSVLAAKYDNLIRVHFYNPRLVMRDSDGDDLLNRYLVVITQRYLRMLQNEANRHARGVQVVRRTFVGAQVRFAEVLFKRFMDFPTPEIANPEYDFLRVITKYEDAPIGPIHANKPAETTKGEAAPKNGRATPSRQIKTALPI